MLPAAAPDPLSLSAMLRVFGTLAIVLVVFVLALRGLRRLQGGRTPQGALRVVGSLSLSPRERLLLVQVGAQQLLIGSSAQGMNCLHVLPEPLPTDPPAAPPLAQALSGNFAELMRRARGQAAQIPPGGEGGR